MGLIRLWLAFVVYFEHVGGEFHFHLMDGMTAVRCFFMISGFLMQMVLLQKYYNPSAHWKRDFWKSRVLRIYPLYWAILAATVLFVLIAKVPPRYYLWRPMDYGMAHATSHPQLIFESGRFLTEIGYVLSHIFLFGSDIGQYIVYNLDRSEFNLYGQSPYTDFLWGRSFMLIPQAWSLTIELWFYLFAPFLLLKSTRAVIITAIAVPFIRKLFPNPAYAVDIFTELPYFLAGALACRIYLKSLQGGAQHKVITSGLLCGGLLSTIAYNAIPFSYKEQGVYLVLFCTLPFAFNCLKTNRVDRFLGDLSYPVYLVHFLTHGLALTLFDEPSASYATLALTIMAAVACVYGVERPVDAWRHRLFRKKAKPSASFPLEENPPVLSRK